MKLKGKYFLHDEIMYKNKKYIFYVKFEIYNQRTLLPVSLMDFQKERKEKRGKRKERKKLPEKRNILP